MLLIPLGLDQSRGDQIDNAENFESKGMVEPSLKINLHRLNY